MHSRETTPATPRSQPSYRVSPIWIVPRGPVTLRAPSQALDILFETPNVRVERRARTEDHCGATAASRASARTRGWASAPLRTYRSSGESPVCLDIRANIRGPIFLTMVERKHVIWPPIATSNAGGRSGSTACYAAFFTATGYLVSTGSGQTRRAKVKVWEASAAFLYRHAVTDEASNQ